MLDILKKFNMLNCKTVSTPINISKKFCINDGTMKIDERLFRMIVGNIIFLRHIRPEIMFCVSMISKFMHYPSSHHLGAAKRILKYIYGTMDLKIHYHKGQIF